MQRTANDAVNYQNLLNTANERFNTLMNDLTATRNDLLRRTNMLTQARNDEADERRVWWLRSQFSKSRKT